MFCTAVATRRPSSATSSTSSAVNVPASRRESAIIPIGDLARADALEHRAAQGADASRREHRPRSGAGRGDRPGVLALNEHDRGAVEREEALHLADERAERLLDLER